ncbi:HAD-IIIC family phosphatase [Anaerosacchariphilus polymeriproducens]|uniref:HAD-IIIC family phosphatase n=2 Tax=Anaerosacchariphilus polymeriproducens TaxID=1812858 RepID=A0A371ARB0_9FIRM|nr:HAD-IIIC family phosphatase [Anaerosacchariphilus polymeriproducens]RDU22109.1 HAD-IIIC family phosphatase [Anaerosacchariphilus polymeriproducens]
MKIAVLSNINIDPIVRKLSKVQNIFQNQGYGNIFESLYNKQSALHHFQPNVIFFLIDLENLITVETEENTNPFDVINNWFQKIEAIMTEDTVYVISNGICSSDYLLGIEDSIEIAEIESEWNHRLNSFSKENNNVYQFDIRTLCNRLGKEQFFSTKSWYLGKIKHSNIGQQYIADNIQLWLKAYSNKNKKVLILDLDNTLWGGVVGEEGALGVKISDSGMGMIFQEAQKKFSKIKDTGVVLCIASKNNLEDAKEVFDKNPNMILKWDDFVLKKINWELKSQNINEIANELNVGLDSIVFIDDNPVEREMVKENLPDVIVPEFPTKIDAYEKFIEEVYINYFWKLNLTSEDKKKTEIYLQNVARNSLKQTLSFEDYLKSLECQVGLIEDPKDHIERINQLINKTNQFNLTTIRYSEQEIKEMLDDDTYRFYLFNCKDKFGDNGIISLVITKTENGQAYIIMFTMSCRVMGRLIENYILDYVENDMKKFGYKEINAKYVYTQKSKPVETLYENLGYEILTANETLKEYRLNLDTKSKRTFYVNGCE